MVKMDIWMNEPLQENHPTALLAGGAGALYERFAAGKTSAQGRLCRPEH